MRTNDVSNRKLNFPNRGAVALCRRLDVHPINFFLGVSALWYNLRKFIDIPFLLTGMVLTFYIGASAFGFVKNSAEHYSNFILGTCIMTGLLAMRGLIDEKINNQVKRFFAGRFAFAATAFVLSAIGMVCTI